MRKLYGTALLGLAVLLAMGLSACGGSDSDSSSTTTTAAKSASPVLGRTCTTPGAKGKTASGEPVECGQGPGGGPNQWISTGTTPPSSTTAAQTPSNAAANGASCTTQGATAKDQATGDSLVCGQPPVGGGLIWHNP